MKWFKEILHSVLRLSIGELVARLASFALMAYISRRYGLELLGAYTLAQTVAIYATQGTDLGFRLIGTRLIARNANLANSIVPLISRKRSFTGALCVTAGLIYAFWGPMPTYARLCVAGFVLGILPYALSLDWLAWGLSHFGWLGSWRAGVGIILTAGSLIGFHFIADPRVSLILANFVAFAIGSFALWILWRVSWKKRLPSSSLPTEDGSHDLRWSAAISLGFYVILIQAFHNFDTILLGAMAPLSELGRYSAAYKILFTISGAFYLITQSIYPRLSASTGGTETRNLVLIGIGGVAVFGTLIAVVLCLFASPILTLIYGSNLGAIHLVRILAFIVPMEFVAALLTASFTSRGFERFLLAACGSAAVFNIGANLVLIPKMAADGAAIATIISYVLLIVILLVGFAVKPVFVEGVAPSYAQAGQD